MKQQQGFALITVLIMLVVFTALITAYFTLTGIELSTTASSAASTSGFYASEAGLNMRGEAIRQTFLDYNRPHGAALNPNAACQNGGAIGSGDFACKTISVGGRNVTTYVVEKPENNSPNENDRMVRIPNGETFSGLNAIQYGYTVVSDARSPRDGSLEARTEMDFRSRLVPVFQFAAFYNKDLEILPGADMTLNGRVHVNGDLYTNANATLNITGKVTAAKHEGANTGGGFYRRRKDSNSCGGTVRVDDADASTETNPDVKCSGKIAQSTLDAWNGQIKTELDTLTVPEVEAFNVGGQYWDQADLRVALDLNKTPPEIIVPNKTIIAGNVTKNSTMTDKLISNSCKASSGSTRAYTDRSGSGSQIRAVEWSNSFRDNREGKNINMLEVDIQALLECMHKHKNQLFDQSASSQGDINDTSQGGLVVYLTVIGANQDDVDNNYGVRVRNGDQLKSAKAGDPAIKGLTFVTDQAMYVQGDYNRDDRPGDTWKPASFLADSLNILSNAWNNDTKSTQALDSGNRNALSTQVNAAFLAGTDSTGNKEGTGGQGGAYNGGLENYPRLHEWWQDRTLTYKGSFVSFDRPQHVNGKWGKSNVYKAPNRNWSYDTRFNNAENLPPMAPRFVYLQQERFAREFER